MEVVYLVQTHSGTSRVNNPDGRLDQLMENNTSKWFLRFHQCADARLRLFCFPNAGGGASLFRRWHFLLNEGIEVFPVQLPGRESRLSEQPLDQLESILVGLSKAIRPYFDLPFAFFGHSLGALISFELARRLRAAQSPGPCMLFVSAHIAPQLPSQRPATYNLPDQEFMEKMRWLNGTPEIILQEESAMQFFLPLLRADIAIAETYYYTPGLPLECPIQVFGGVQDEEATRLSLEAWRELTTGRFDLTIFPGDHFFLNTWNQAVIQIINKHLEQF